MMLIRGVSMQCTRRREEQDSLVCVRYIACHCRETEVGVGGQADVGYVETVGPVVPCLDLGKL